MATEGIINVEKCSDHPRYQGLRKPRIDCAGCRTRYEEVKKLKKDKLVKETRSRKSKKGASDESAPDNPVMVPDSEKSEVPVVAEVVCDEGFPEEAECDAPVEDLTEEEELPEEETAEGIGEYDLPIDDDTEEENDLTDML